MWVLAASVSLSFSAIPTVPGMAETPAMWTLPPFHIDDRITFNDGSRQFVLDIGNNAVTRDVFGARVAATVVHVFDATDDPHRDPPRRWLRHVNVSIDDASGVQIWWEDPSEPPGHHRSYVTASMPYMFGASVLGGRTIAAGDLIHVPLWDGFHTHISDLNVLEPTVFNGQDVIPIHVTLPPIPGVSPDFVRLMGASRQTLVDGSTLLMSKSSPFPIAVLQGEYVRARLVSYEPGAGAVAWRTDSDFGAPWNKNPAMDFLGVEPGGPPPERSDGAPYANLSLQDAVAFAVENAPGLAAFTEAHENVVFAKASWSHDEGGATIQPFGLAEIYRSTWQDWWLTWQGEGSEATWTVQVLLERQYVGGIEIEPLRRLEIAGEHAGVRYTGFGVSISDSQAEFSQVMSAIPERLGGSRFVGIGVVRLNASAVWTPTPKFWYKTYYVEPFLCGGLCIVPAWWITLDASAGTVVEVEGPRPFIEAFDSYDFAFFG